MTKRPPATPLYIEDPLPLECAGCHRPWPSTCACRHLSTCRRCGRPLADPVLAAGYCTAACLHGGVLVK